MMSKYKYNPRIGFTFSILIFAILNAQVSGDISSNEFVWLGILLSDVNFFIYRNNI